MKTLSRRKFIGFGGRLAFWGLGVAPARAICENDGVGLHNAPSGDDPKNQPQNEIKCCVER